MPCPSYSCCVIPNAERDLLFVLSLAAPLLSLCRGRLPRRAVPLCGSHLRLWSAAPARRRQGLTPLSRSGARRPVFDFIAAGFPPSCGGPDGWRLPRRRWSGSGSPASCVLQGVGAAPVYRERSEGPRLPRTSRGASRGPGREPGSCSGGSSGPRLQFCSAVTELVPTQSGGRHLCLLPV
jgi:hypothetical protein